MNSALQGVRLPLTYSLIHAINLCYGHLSNFKVTGDKKMSMSMSMA